MTDTRDSFEKAARAVVDALNWVVSSSNRNGIVLSATDINSLAEAGRNLYAALTALQAGAGDGWQHIESAPKDGTEVFVYVPGDSNYPTAAYYSSKEYFETEYGDPDYMDEGWYWSFGYPSDFHEETIEPTHWMPIPESPEPIDQNPVEPKDPKPQDANTDGN